MRNYIGIINGSVVMLLIGLFPNVYAIPAIPPITDMQTTIDQARHSGELMFKGLDLMERCDNVLKPNEPDYSIWYQCANFVAKLDNHLSSAFNEADVDIKTILGYTHYDIPMLRADTPEELNKSVYNR